MNFCFRISHRLAAYCEGELSSDERACIAAHLDECAGCRARAEQIRKNMHLMQQLPRLEPADELWNSIARELSVSRWPEPARVASPARRLGFGLRWALRPAAMVAALFIIATALLLASRYGLLPGSHKGELNLAGYLDLVGTVASAEPALREFPAAPGFTKVSWPEARTAVNFPAIAPESLPGGYRLTAVRLYTHGNLRALQFKYRSEQGGLCVFQLPADSKLSFGERPSEQYKADGAHCRRTSSKSCSVYRFVLGETQYVLMMRQTDPAVVGALIQTFNAEYEKTQ
jgi:anti-sigma factor RsiW